jgi:hypothetical protein
MPEAPGFSVLSNQRVFRKIFRKASFALPACLRQFMRISLTFSLRNGSHSPVMVSAGGNQHTLGRRKAALSTPHRKFATRYVTASRAAKKQT